MTNLAPSQTFNDYDLGQVVVVDSEPATSVHSHCHSRSMNDTHQEHYNDKDTRGSDTPTPTPRVHEEQLSLPPMHTFNDPFPKPSPSQWIDRRYSLPTDSVSQLDDSFHVSKVKRTDRAGSDGQQVPAFNGEKPPEIAESLHRQSLSGPPATITTATPSLRSRDQTKATIPSQTPSITSSQKPASKLRFPKLGFSFPPPPEPQPRRVPLKQPNAPRSPTSANGISNKDIVDGKIPQRPRRTPTKSPSVSSTMSGRSAPIDSLSPPSLSHSPSSAVSSLPSVSLGQPASSCASLESSTLSMGKGHRQRHSISSAPEPCPTSQPYDKATWSLFEEIEEQNKFARKEIVRKPKVQKETSESIFDQNTPPSKKALYEAGLIEVISDNGEIVPFARLVQRRTIVIFIRHWGSPLCAQYMYIQSIIRDVRQEALDEAGVDLVVIGHGSAKTLSAYKNQALHCPLRMYTDPTLKIYHALGLNNQSESTFSTLKRAVKMPLHNPGHHFQLGADFIFENPLKVSFTHRMDTTRDHLPISDICDMAGVRLEWIHYEPGPPPPSIHRLSIRRHDIIIEDETEANDDWRVARDLERENIRKRKEDRMAMMVQKAQARMLRLEVDSEDLGLDKY